MPNSYRTRSYGPRRSNFGPARPRHNYRGNSRGGRSGQAIDPSRFIKKASIMDDAPYQPQNSFADFALDARLAKNIVDLGYKEPLPIQDQAIPVAMSGSDVIGLANTGTGKTAAFAIPLIHKHLQSKQQSIVIAPTRELAIQIESDIQNLSRNLNILTVLCVGGQPLYRQQSKLKRNPDFIIGTPGRIKDLIKRRALRLEFCKSLVLDEVDRMVDMGFINDIKEILSHIPQNRQSLFFTATISPSVEVIMRNFLQNPVRISVTKGETAENIEQDVVRVAVGENKLDKLQSILNDQKTGKTLVFGQTKRGVEKIHTTLSSKGIASVSIHGNKTQGQRQRALLQFRSGEAQVMVATDVAARGLDIKDITHVINYETPQSYDDYIHRIGRAGRAGNKGYALTFI